MRKKIKGIIPKTFLQRYRRYNYSRKKSVFYGKPPKEVFTQIYETNHWKGKNSVSGAGAELSQTHTIINSIGSLIEELGIRTVLDLPCGDFNWMRKVDLTRVKYIGGDIVNDLIEQNSEKYSNDHTRFEVMDIISDRLPKSDLIINRDCLVHLSYEDIYRSLENIKLSGSKYLLTTTFTRHSPNYDICTGDWRTLNLSIGPFNFPEPIKLINENCTEDNGNFKDKSLGLFLIDEIKLTTNKYHHS